MLRKGEEGITKKLTETSTWTASTELTPVDLPREGLITEITIRAAMTATLTATALDDFWRRVIQALKIQGDGGNSYLGMSGAPSAQLGVMLGLWNEVVLGCPTIHSNGAGIALAAVDVGSTVFVSEFKYHPGSNPTDPFDQSVVIPARALATLQAILTAPAAAVVDGSGNITAGTYSYEICEVLGAPINAGTMVPDGSTLGYAHTANYSDYSYDIDIPAGAWLRSIVLMINDDTATTPRRKDDEVTGIKIKIPKSGSFILEQSIYEAKMAMMTRHRARGIAGDVGPIGAIATIRPAPTAALDIIPAGFVVIDLRPYGHPLYGLNLTNYQTGDFKLGLTIENYAAGDDTTIYWDRILPVSRQYYGK